MLQQNKKNVMDGHSIKIRIKIYTRSTLHIMYYVLLFIYDYLEKSVRKKKRSLSNNQKNQKNIEITQKAKSPSSTSKRTRRRNHTNLSTTALESVEAEHKQDSQFVEKRSS